MIRQPRWPVERITLLFTFPISEEFVDCEPLKDLLIEVRQWRFERRGITPVVTLTGAITADGERSPLDSDSAHALADFDSPADTCHKPPRSCTPLASCGTDCPHTPVIKPAPDVLAMVGEIYRKRYGDAKASWVGKCQRVAWGVNISIYTASQAIGSLSLYPPIDGS
jgi:hypothetical protein